MKTKLSAFFVLLGLVAASFSPIWAGFSDREEVIVCCTVGFLPNGDPIIEVIVSDCVPNPMRSCRPDQGPLCFMAGD